MSKQKQKTICVHNMFSPCSELAIFMNNLLSYCGLVDARISASERDLPCMWELFPKINKCVGPNKAMYILHR
jgi:hypothetical protein